jgi:hypothetical protein
MKMRRLLPRYLNPLVLCILFLAACGTLEVGGGVHPHARTRRRGHGGRTGH